MPEAIDFHVVAERHQAIHGRLKNWGSWCHSRGGSTSQPMFRWCKPSQQWEATELRVPVDALAALLIERNMRWLPELNRTALAWCYVSRTTPRAICRKIGLAERQLWEHLEAGRTMIQNVTR